MPRAFALLTIAAILALSVTIVAKSPIESQAAGSSPLAGNELAWGNGSNGELGTGSLGSSTPIPVSLPSGTTVSAIAGGGTHSLAVTATGQVLAWGDNLFGQLGNGTSANSNTPVPVSLPSGTAATTVAGGRNFSLAVTSGGQVLGWGENTFGQLGNGGSGNSNIPVATSLPSGTSVTAIAAGGYHSLALTSAGQVLAWGINSNGELGTGTTSTNGCGCISTPVAVSLPSGTTVTAIAGGQYHSLAVTSAGQVLAWGYNSTGQLGNGTVSTTGCTCSSIPVSVSLPSGTTVTAVAGGQSHSLALTSTGQVLAWGSNYNGELGNGTTTTTGCGCISTPVAVSLPPGTTVTAIASGASFSLALASTGEVLAWGSNAYGKLGNGTTTSSSTPVPVSLPTGATIGAIAAGWNHGLAIELPTGAAFPAMANGAYGGYVTAATIQNIGTGPATVAIAYFNQSGMPVGTGDLVSNLPVNASWTVRQDNGHSFPSSGGNASQAGSAVVYSTQPIASFVNEFPPGSLGDATSYSGVQVPSGVGTTLYAPTIVNGAYGGYTTGIGLLNQGSSATDVTITYRDGYGGLVKTQTVTALAAHAYQALYSGDATLALPAGFAGTATITSSTAQPLGAIVNETGPGGQFSSYDAVPSGSTQLDVPVALNNAYGGYYTGIGIQNTSTSAGLVYVSYFDGSGAATSKSFFIGPNGSLGVYQGSATDGPPAGAYTATISSVLSLAAIVNEVAPAGTGSARQSTSYNTFGGGTPVLHLPLVENAASDPWNTGEGIMNTSSGSTTVTITYYDGATGAAIGTAQSKTLAPQAFWGLYQPTGGLPSGTRATAVVTTFSGGSVAVICNESSPTTFMSYEGQ